MIKCIPTITPQIKSREGCLFVVEVELTAHNPFFLDVAENVMKMDDYTGGLTFPLAGAMKFAEKGDLSRINNTDSWFPS